MPSRVNPPIVPDAPQRTFSAAFLVWNRRLHFYIGLYLLFFTWLFTFTGLLLNHPKWQFAQFWPNRVQSSAIEQFRTPECATDLECAREVMQQLGIVGEIQWPAAQPGDGSLAFQVSRPGHIVDVKADLRTERATVQRTELNAWGIMHVLHTFVGVRAGDSTNDRDWMLTGIWALAMDAVAAGLILMVFSSYIMWYRLNGKRLGGTIALGIGLAACGVFAAGLRWLL
jgi:hypothetical protein